MQIQRIAISAVFAAAIAALPLGTAKAQYYPPCSPFPLFWPFCIAGAVVGTAATIVTAPFRAVAAPPVYPYGVPPQPPGAPGYPPGYPPQPYGYPPR
jgi:hypothetical protein